RVLPRPGVRRRPRRPPRPHRGLSPPDCVSTRAGSSGFGFGTGLFGGELCECGEIFDADEVKAVGEVGIAQEQVLATGCEQSVMTGATPDAQQRRVRLVIAPAPADRPEVMHLQAGAPVTTRPAALPVTKPNTAHDLGRQRAPGPDPRHGYGDIVDEDRFDL